MNFDENAPSQHAFGACCYEIVIASLQKSARRDFAR